MRRKRIAAMMAGVDREYQHALINGMCRSAKARGVDLCIFNCMGHADGFERNDRGERAIFELPELSDFDGLVLLQATIPTQECRQLICSRLAQYPDMPLVTIDDMIDQSVEITFDDLTSVRSLMEHLFRAHGVRRLAVVTGPMDSPVAMDRFHVVQELAGEYGAELPADRIYDGQWVREGGRLAAEKLLESGGELPEAIICGNDDMALGVIERLAEAGVSVPGQVKVTGFDARPEAVSLGLTTIRRPVRDAGAMAVDILLDWMDNGRPQERRICLPTQNVYGESCGCAADVGRANRYVRVLSEERRAVEESLLQAAGFFGGLAGVTGAQEAGRLISGFASNWGAEEMHICVDPAILEAKEQAHETVYPQEMLLLSGWSRGKQAAQARFATSELLPRLNEERDEPLALVFCPMYHAEKNLGYAVFDVRHATGYALYALLTLISGSLISLSLRLTVRVYAVALEHMSIHDALTGLYNRRGYERVVPPIFEKAQEESSCFAVISCDMDGMKRINDSFGHLSGDQAIFRMGKALRVLEEHGMVCVHISGDEFLALGVVPDPAAAEDRLTTLRESIVHQNSDDPWICDIAASIGLYAAIPIKGDSIEAFLQQADRRMYANKKNRRTE